MDAQELVKLLEQAFADRQLFLVGGCVRDQLLGRAISDLDIATDARPEEIHQRVANWADSVWLVGEKFGTVGVIKDSVKAEITTFRTDTYDGVSRKPEVEFGGSIQEDLARRDFTINAMARNVHTGELLDPFGGRQDLAQRLLRFVGDPQTRIREDPLRMLRAVRFCAQLGFELEPVSAVAIAALAEDLTRISWERIRDELDAILLSPHPDEGLRLAINLGLARYFLPELASLQLPEPGRYQVKDLLQHTLEIVCRVPADKTLRYAALLHDIAKPQTFSTDDTGVHFYRHEQLGAEQARAILSRLRQPAGFIAQVTNLIHNHLRIPYYSSEWTEAAIRRLLYDFGDQLDNALALAEADVRASDPVDLPEFERGLAELRSRIQGVEEAEEIARLKPLLTGHEVMEMLGIEPGPKVGEVLDFLLNEQIEGRIATREEAIAVVKERFGDGN